MEFETSGCRIYKHFEIGWDLKDWALPIRIHWDREMCVHFLCVYLSLEGEDRPQSELTRV